MVDGGTSGGREAIDLEEVNRLLFKYDNDATFGVRQFHAALVGAIPQQGESQHG